MKLKIYKKGSVFTSGCFISERLLPPPNGYFLYAEIDCYRAASAAKSLGVEIEKENPRYSAQVVTAKTVDSLIHSSTPFSLTFKG